MVCQKVLLHEKRIDTRLGDGLPKVGRAVIKTGVVRSKRKKNRIEGHFGEPFANRKPTDLANRLPKGLQG